MSAFWQNFASNRKKDCRQGARRHTDGISFAFLSLSRVSLHLTEPKSCLRGNAVCWKSRTVTHLHTSSTSSNLRNSSKQKFTKTKAEKNVRLCISTILPMLDHMDPKITLVRDLLTPPPPTRWGKENSGFFFPVLKLFPSGS